MSWDDWFRNIQLDRIELKLDAVLGKLNAAGVRLDTIIQKENEMAGELDELEAKVTAEGTVIGSAVALLQQLHQMLADAIASGDMTRVAAVNAQIAAQTDSLAAAVVANTPAA